MGNKTEKAKQVITEFRQSKYKLNSDGTYDESVKELSEDLTNAVEQLATGLYEKDIHFVMELIQNAEDNNYIKDVNPKLEFVLLNNDPTNTDGSDGCLCIFNNELGFQLENIKSISGIGKSTKKKAEGFIGEKGIGFKSVYVVSSSPHIFSNGYQIKFYENDPNFYLNYIVPYWVDHVPDIVDQSDVTTSLLLPLKESKKEQIINHLADIQPESILFLNKLEGLSIKIEKDESEIVFKRINLGNDVYKLEVIKDDLKESRHYWIYKETISVPRHIKEDKRQNINEREVTLAFPIDNLSLKGKVFSYLPTEADSGFPFLINADFMLTANRESIQTERDWNVWLQEALPEVIVNALVKMQKIEKVKKAVYLFIPVSNEEKPSDYFSSIGHNVCKRLKELKFIFTDRNEMVLSENSYLVPVAARNLLDFTQRPKWFNSFYFVDLELEKYSEQLFLIGVKKFSKDELMLILGDEEWLELRELNWFYHLYQYLRKNLISSSLSDKKIIPLESSEVTSPSNTIFWLSDQSVLESLESILSNDDLPSLNFLNNTILKKAQEDDGVLLRWINKNLGVSEFSISSYLSESLLPWMDSHIALLDTEKVLTITTFILKQWSCLSGDTKEVIGEKLPVVLESNYVARKSELEGHELLVPRGFDPDTGWQNMLKEPDEYDHSDVLNKAYLRLREDEDTFKEFMKCISAWAYPDLKEYSLTSVWGVDDEILSSYINEIFNSEYSTRGKTLTTWAAPYFLNSSSLLEVAKNRNSLLHWLEVMIENRDFDLKNAKFKWFNYSSKQKHIESYLFHCLRRTSWINTTKGLKKPGEVFVESKSIREIFQDKLPYLKDTISPELCDFLLIKTEVTTESILDYLGVLTNEKIVDKSLIIKLYEYLRNHGSDFKDAFDENKYIYVPDSLNSWYSVDEVIWENAKDAFGDNFAWLSVHYPKLKDFFIDGLDVKESIDDQSILDTWLKLQVGLESKYKTEPFLSFAIPKIISMIKGGEIDDSLETFFDEAYLWVQTHKWINVDWQKAYIPDDIRLRNLFKGEDIYYPWLALSAHAHQSMIYERFNLSKLSESVSYLIRDPRGFTIKNINEVLTNHTVQLLCEMIVNEDRHEEKWFQEQINSGLIYSLLHAVEKEGTNLVVEVSLDDLDTKMMPEVSAFFDRELATLFIKTGADIEDVKDDVAESLAREIWKNKYKPYVDTIRNLMAVTSEKRYKKIRESKGWYFGKEYRDKLKELIDTPFGFDEPEPPVKDNLSDALNDTITKDVFENVNTENPTDIPPNYLSSEKNVRGDFKNSESLDDIEVGNISVQNKNDQSDSVFIGSSGSGIHRKIHDNDRPSPDGRKRSQRTSHINYGSRVSKARSGNINRQTNTVRRNRMVSYVVNELNETKENGNDIEKARARKKQGEITEKIVFDDLSVKGYEVKQMPEGNKGYDLEAIDPQNGELYYIEVKSDAFQWSEKGVGISFSQYEFAREKRDSFILAIVDNLASVHSAPIYVINPVSLITEYRFDHMWSKVSTNLRTIEIESEENVVQELMSLTDSTRCKELIKFCDEKKYPLPDVGIEISNVDGEVIFEDIELGWEQEKIAVVLDKIDRAILADSGWEFFIESDEEIESILEEVFRGAD